MSERTYDLFLSYNWRDREYAEGIAHRLKERGLHIFLDRWYQVPGRAWIEVLEEVVNQCSAIAVLLGPNGMGPWQQREKNLALLRRDREPDFPIIPTLLPGSDSALGFLSLETWVDLRGGLDDEEALRVLELAVRGEPPGPDVRRSMREARSSVCPYRGLRPFREEDAPFFFGREDCTRKLADMIERHSLVAVVGASGSGKSSVVRAGLVPRVRQGIGDQLWEVATFVPGESPLRSLAASLLPFLEPEMTEVNRLREVKKLAQSLLEKEILLQDVVAKVLEKQHGTDRLLLVVDQWEEIYTICDNEQERCRFIDEILGIAQRGPVGAVFTMRADFYDRLLEHRRLAERLQEAVISLVPMTYDELRRVIESPAHKMDLRLEAGLVQRILADVRQAPGSLPYLEFALTRLWEERGDNTLRHQTYDDLGLREYRGGADDSDPAPLRRVIAHYAEREFNNILAKGQEERTIQKIFLRLVQPGNEREDTRRRIKLEGLDQKEISVIQDLADARLVVTSRDEATGSRIVELAHEILIAGWTRLADWIEDHRQFLLWSRRFRSFVETWEDSGRDKSALLRGRPLAEARQWSRKHGSLLDQLDLGFIKTSVRHERDSRKREVIVALVIFISIILSLYFTYKEPDLQPSLGNVYYIHPEDMNREPRRRSSVRIPPDRKSLALVFSLMYPTVAEHRLKIRYPNSELMWETIATPDERSEIVVQLPTSLFVIEGTYSASLEAKATNRVIDEYSFYIEFEESPE